MKLPEQDFPLEIRISFNKLIESYRPFLDSENLMEQERAARIFKIAEEHPILIEGLSTAAQMKKYKNEIDLMLEDIFPSILQSNEIKTATIPFQAMVFKSTQRYKNIIEAAGKDYQLELVNFDNRNTYIMGCSIILNAYYGYKADFKRPFFYEIPDVNGNIKSYKVLFNADFIEIEKTDKAKEITEADYLELLENFDNIEVWREKFPPGSWVSKGFVIANMYDATADVALSNFKGSLLKDETKDVGFIEDFRTIIRSIFNLSDLNIGYTIFNEEEESFEKVPDLMRIDSYLLSGSENEPISEALCEYSYDTIFKKNKFYCISDVAHYYKLYPKNALYKKFHKKGVQSAIVTPIMIDEKVMGVLEIVSDTPKVLNSINAHKLQDIMPFLTDSVKRSNENAENSMELLIQQECTAIHSSVHWKFKQEAGRVHKAQLNGEQTSFNEIVFKNVYPLYGQIDIKGSSVARNTATKEDLTLELELVQKVIRAINTIEPLPIYDQIDFRISTFLDELTGQLQVDSERNVMSFLNAEILPLFKHLRKKSKELKVVIEEYSNFVDAEKGIVYRNRKDYDETVMLINKKMAAILDGKQVEAQKMYPHYFERFKTDGVEHSLYIGESITKKESFNKIYLYNLRLWQLQAMCEMENKFYQLKESLPMPLDVASMILVFGSSLSLRFRMDEKRFDVDGTYNARYEVVKKRVDKANIKGTNERITQAGKISIIYSQSEDEREYLKYVKFLQYKKQLGDTIEIVELDDLQGVTGLKAIRVNVLYNFGEKDKAYYTYEDLMDEIDS